MIVKTKIFWAVAAMAALTFTGQSSVLAEDQVPGPPGESDASTRPLAPAVTDADLDILTINQALADDSDSLEEGTILPVGRRSSEGGRKRRSRHSGGLQEGRILGMPPVENQFAEQSPVGNMVYENGRWQIAEGSLTPPAAPAVNGTSADEAEATVRITDRTPDRVGDAPPLPKASKHVCPWCRHCPHNIPYHECPECQPPARMMRRYRRTHGMVFSPDYGWAPPGRTPISRVSIDYARYWPGCWTAPGHAHAQRITRPVVYYPTDTTQLGYTYQHTPRWLPYEGMVPPVPHPRQWHQPSCNLYCPVCGPNTCPVCQEGTQEADQTPPEPPADEAKPPKPADVPSPPTGKTIEAAEGPELNRSAEVPPLVPVPF